MGKIFSKVLAITLCIAIFLPVIPPVTIAEETTPSTSTQEEQPEAKILEEDVSLREESVKHFLMNDGTMTAVQYGEPVHFKQNDKWKDIDNTLVENTAGYTTKNGAHKVKLASNSSDKDLVSLENGEQKVSFGLKDDKVNKSYIKVKDKTSDKKIKYKDAKTEKQIEQYNEETTTLENVTSESTYENVFDNVDFKYDILPEGVKENIILKDKTAQTQFSFEFNLSGLYMQQMKDGSIEVLDSNNKVQYTIPNAFMYDSSGIEQENGKVDMTLDGKNGKYTISLIADNNWINDESRVFPITIDPQIIKQSTTATESVYILASDTANRKSGELKVGNTTTSDAIRTLIKPTLPTLPPSAKLNEAYLKLYRHSDFMTPTSAYKDLTTINLIDCTSSWSGSTVSWSAQPTYGTYTFDTRQIKIGQIKDTYEWDITRLVNSWYGGQANYGMLLRYHTENIAGNSISCFRANSTSVSGAQPTLILNYVYTTGIDSNYDMHTIDVGRAGTVNINDFTGKLMLSRHDMGFDGNVMPVNIDLFYDNAMMTKTQFTEANKTFMTLKTNIVLHDSVMAGVYGFLYQDENGVMRHLVANGNVYSDDNGNEIRKKDTTIGWSILSNIILRTPDGLDIEFNVDGFVTQITDTTKPVQPYPFIKILKQDATKTIITDGAGRKYQLNYTNNLLSSVQYFGTGATVLQTVTYGYNGTGTNITSVKYPDGKIVSYDYDTNGNMTLIKDVDGYALKVTYTNNKVTKVEEFAKYGTALEQTNGDYIDITYSDKFTTFTDSKAHKETKQFDRYGNTTCTYNENGYAIFNTYNGKELLGSSEIHKPADNNLLKNWDFSNTTNANWIAGNSRTGGSNPTLENIATVQLPCSKNDLRIVGNISEGYYAKQVVSGTWKVGETFSYGGWGYNAPGVLPLVNSAGEPVPENRTYGMQIFIPKEAGGECTEKLTGFDFNVYNKQIFEYHMDGFTLPYNVSKIEVRLVAEYQRDNCYWGEVELSKGTLYNYTTDDNGNIKQNETTPVIPTPGPTEVPNTTSPVPTTMVTGLPTSSDYRATTYSVSGCGVNSRQTIDRYENVLSNITYNGTKTIETTNSYSSNGNYLSSTTDSSGSTTTYGYNQNLGVLDSQKNANNKTISYTYDNMQRQTGTSIDVSGLANNAIAITNSYAYDGDRLQAITRNGFNYTFSYNKWGEQSEVNVGSRNLVSYVFSDNATRLLNTLKFGNDQSQIYSYYANNDTNIGARGQLKGVRFNVEPSDKLRYQYEYDPLKGNMTVKRDYVSMTYTKYKDELVEEYAMNSDGTIQANATPKHSYAQDGDKLIEKIGSKTTTTTTTSDVDGRPSTLSYNYGTNKIAVVSTSYDGFGRTGSKQQKVNYVSVYTQNYTYRDISPTQTTEQISALNTTYTGGSSNLSYTYDNLGNITEIKKNGTSVANYTYDEAGQLTRVDDAEQNKSITYTYNAGGNIVQTTEYAYTTGTLGTATKTVPYAYGDNNWPDKLTSYDGKSISYDNIGNLTSYDGWNYTWEGGRQLKTAVVAGSNPQSLSFAYNDDGIRTSKTVNGNKINYTLRGSTIIAQETNGNYIYFRYGDDDQLLSLNYQGDEYFYLKNIQGDITGIVDELGYLVVEYTYDTWGNQLSCTGTMATSLGVANPFRYRSYYFDVETGLYYLQSRYYNPEWKRFISADDTDALEYEELIATNLFSYCHNDSVNMDDSDGKHPFKIDKTTKMISPNIQVFIGMHRVVPLLPWFHASIIIGASTKTKFRDTKIFKSTFKAIPSTKNSKYLTLGAGPGKFGTSEYGYLISGINRPQDKRFDNKDNGKGEYVNLGVKDISKANQLIQKEENYRNLLTQNKLLYAPFPNKKDGTYNSNSFVHGLLVASGFKNLGLFSPGTGTRNTPGWDIIPHYSYYNGTR